jgi:hypothetical protein
MQDSTSEAALLVRLRAAARAEIEGVLAILEASSLAPPKCAAVVRAWHALAALEAALAGQPAPGAAEFAAELARGDRQGLPPVLRDVNGDFVAAVARCAQGDPGAAESPPKRDLEDQPRVLLRTYAALNRRVRTRLPPRRIPWRTIAAVALGAALLIVPLLVIYRPRWRVSYYPNTTLSGTPRYVTGVLEPDRNWGGHAGPGHGLPDDHFSARYESCLVLDKPATVLFTVGSDDGSILFVDDKRLVDLWTDHPYKILRQTIDLDPGPHTLRLDYFQGNGDARISLDGRIQPSSADITRKLRLPPRGGPVCPR